MSRRSSSHVWTQPLAVALLLAGVGLFTIASQTDAIGIGNPLKKAKDTATKSAETKPAPQAKNDEPPVFDEYVLELTEARVVGMLSACKKSAEALAARQPIVDNLNQVSDERAKLDQKEGEKVRDLQRKRGDVEVCYHDEYQKYLEKRRQELSAKAMSDPSSMQELSKLIQEQAMAQAKGDTAGVQRTTAAMMKWGAPTHDDTLAVKKKCGPIPPHSAAEDQLVAYDKQIASLNEQLRQMDERAAKEQAKATGMNEQQWGGARERIDAFLGIYKANGPEPGGYSEAELDAMEKHLQQLKDAQKNGCL